jgi:hypothetical protein
MLSQGLGRPNLEDRALADEGGALADARVLGQLGRQDDAAVAVERQLLGVREDGRRQIVVGIGEEWASEKRSIEEMLSFRRSMKSMPQASIAATR